MEEACASWLSLERGMSAQNCLPITGEHIARANDHERADDETSECNTPPASPLPLAVVAPLNLSGKFPFSILLPARMFGTEELNAEIGNFGPLGRS